MTLESCITIVASFIRLTPGLSFSLITKVHKSGTLLTILERILTAKDKQNKKTVCIKDSTESR